MIDATFLCIEYGEPPCTELLDSQKKYNYKIRSILITCEAIKLNKPI